MAKRYTVDLKEDTFKDLKKRANKMGMTYNGYIRSMLAATKSDVKER